MTLIDQVFDLFYQGIPTNEIAKRMKIPESTIRYWIFKREWKEKENENDDK